jgi:molybdopterin synthase sulfur carrier subunit
MIVRIPSPLRSYTNRLAEVDVPGSSICEVLSNLDSKHPGIRFRMIDEQDQIRQHIKIFVNTELVDSLQKPLNSGDTVHIICALSGG